ncbi:hypothetical protein FLT15_17300 [Paenibacillus thiaminolyticus]|uniref:hypothetical protein n=1 Tax=Paenibacillus thiaminolyticus TaxID=49283 RepID=UPI001164973A|nr:hypothetical protein [Paenibacillus thiaminolyticus]NGP58130.1 hypothetical protein [Paenibacillus thiaminolyticus]NGP60033.1 hypothetical protein [Paenibacillus thiaminolyticus]
MEYGSVEYCKDFLLRSMSMGGPAYLPNGLIGAMQAVLNMENQPPSEILRHAKNLLEAYEEIKTTLK